MNKEIKKLSYEFNFADVPNWYVLCNNNHCPLREDCLRFLAGSHGRRGVRNLCALFATGRNTT